MGIYNNPIPKGIFDKEENDIDHPLPKGSFRTIKGIVFTIHEECEMVGFIFDKKGRLRSPIPKGIFD